MTVRPSAWVLCTGEPLPVDGGTPRLLRAGLLAERLSREGFDIDFWTGDFDHAGKRHRTGSRQVVVRPVGEHYRIRLLPSRGYARNVSLDRVRDHRQAARAFSAAATALPPPRVLVISMPTIDLAHAGARYAVARGIPFVLDLRDLWPEIFYLGRRFPVGSLVRLATIPWSRQLNWTLRRAAAVVGITDDFVEWGCRRSGRTRRPGLDVALPLAYPPAAVPTEEESTEERRLVAEGTLRPDRFQVAFLGAVSLRMDLATVCEAAVEAQERSLPLHFVVAGSGEALEDLRRRYVAPNLRFLGWVDQVVLRAVLRTSRVGLVPYRNTLDFRMSIPNKAIEYLSHGLPVLTSLEGTLRRLVERERIGAGYIEGEPGSLLRLLEAYGRDPGRVDDESRCARDVFERDFSTDVVLGRYASLVRSLTGEPLAQPPR